jgi:hypothetical protein
MKSNAQVAKELELVNYQASEAQERVLAACARLGRTPRWSKPEKKGTGS